MAAKIDPTRRVTLAGLAAGLTALPLGPLLALDEPGLHARALRKGLVFGCAVEARPIQADGAFRDAVLREAGLIVPTFEMKWGQTEANRGATTYDKSEAIADFATSHGLKLRGHAAIWHQNVPGWVPEALGKPDGNSIFASHVLDVVGQFRGRIAQWDVVNEAIEPKDGQPGSLRNSIFLKTQGRSYIAEAFRAARAAAPEAQLYYNDYGVEYATPYEDERRRATLALLGDLRRQRLVDGFGIQGHLKVGNNFDAERFRRFLRDVADLGVAILLTEFDVNDSRLEADVGTRDIKVADHARQFLDAALDERAVKGVVAWGLSDRYTWLNTGVFRRPDGLRSRSLPLDEDMARKPLWNAIARALDGAPVRGPK